MRANVDLIGAFESASPGAVLTCNLVPLNNIGLLRVSYNWLYSALNCDPNDASPFAWVISKTGTGAQVSLSPQAQYAGMTLYASVRPDYGFTVQVQAPSSADWIEAVGGDEIVTMTQRGFFMIALQGLNGSYLSPDGALTQHDDHSGYLFHSNAAAIGPAVTFFVVVNQVHQQVGIPLASTLAAADISAALAAQGAGDPSALMQLILSSRA